MPHCQVHCTPIYKIIFKLIPDNLGSSRAIIGTNFSNIHQAGNIVLFLLPVPRKDMIIFLSVNLIWRRKLIITFVVFSKRKLSNPTIAFVTDFTFTTFPLIGLRKILNLAVAIPNEFSVILLARESR